jgi:hypothetical protein
VVVIAKMDVAVRTRAIEATRREAGRNMTGSLNEKCEME